MSKRFCVTFHPDQNKGGRLFGNRPGFNRYFVFPDRSSDKQPKPYDGSGTPDIVPIEIAAKKQRTAAKKASRPRRRKASGE